MGLPGFIATALVNGCFTLAQGDLIPERALALGLEEPFLLCLSLSLLWFTCSATLSSGPESAAAAIVPCVIRGG